MTTPRRYNAFPQIEEPSTPTRSFSQGSYREASPSRFDLDSSPVRGGSAGFGYDDRGSDDESSDDDDNDDNDEEEEAEEPMDTRFLSRGYSTPAVEENHLVATLQERVEELDKQVREERQRYENEHNELLACQTIGKEVQGVMVQEIERYRTQVCAVYCHKLCYISSSALHR